MIRILSALLLFFCCTAVFGAEPDSVMFPACFQKNTFHICEGFPGLLGFYPVSEPPSENAFLELDLPDFLKFRQACFYNGGKDDPAESRSIRRDGAAYKRIRITLSKAFISCWNQFKSTTAFPHYLKEMIVLDAVKGAAGKEGAVYWRLITGRGTSKDKIVKVKVLPPVRMPAAPAARFTVGFSSVETPGGKYDGYAREFCRFLKGLTKAEIFANLQYDIPVPDPQFASAKSSGSVCFFPNFRPDPVEREIRLGKMNGKYPTTSDHHNYRGLALSYMVDDPDGFFAGYLKDGILRFRNASPQARYIRWDYEPLASQYSQYDLEVFCRRFLKINQVMSYPEIMKKYPRQWSDFMYSQSEKLVKIYSDAVRRYWPGVKLMMVSGYMDRHHPENRYRSTYTPLDVRETEKYFDVHSPMIYYQGTDFYDDVALNMRYLKKPFLPWIDPSEHSKVFFDRYTPEGVRQNILACAALGARGIVFYPVSGLDGRYYPVIADAVRQIAAAEPVLAGKDISARSRVRAANVIEMDLADAAGKSAKVVMPRLDDKIRWLIREKDGRFAAALFNYNDTHVFLRMDIPGFADGRLVKLGPSDAVILTRLPEQKPLLAELEEELTALRRNTRFKQVKHGGSTVAWRALDGKAYPALITGRCTLSVEPETASPRAWACPFPSWDPLIFHRHTRGHLGRIFLMDNTLPIPLPFTLRKFDLDARRPSMILEHVQKPFGGFQEMENRFEGLHIISKWILDFKGNKAILRCTAENRHDKRSIPVILKIQSLPRIGNKFGKPAPGILRIDGRIVAAQTDGNFVLVKPGRRSGMYSPRRPEYAWKNPGPAVVSCQVEKYDEVLTVTPDPQTAAFYNWYGNKELTVEFLTEETVLKPGEKIAYEYIFEYRMEKRKK